MTGLTKLARKRDPNVPIGQPSALHVDCPCGRQVVLTTDRNPCDCGEAYNLGGWILDPQPIADFARELEPARSVRTRTEPHADPQSVRLRRRQT